MPITLELSPPMYQQVNRLDAKAILHLARQRSKRFDNLSRSELVDRLFDVGEAIRQKAIIEGTTIEDIPLNGR